MRDGPSDTAKRQAGYLGLGGERPRHTRTSAPLLCNNIIIVIVIIVVIIITNNNNSFQKPTGLRRVSSDVLEYQCPVQQCSSARRR